MTKQLPTTDANPLDAHDAAVWFDLLTEEQREEMCALLAAHDLDPSSVKAVTYAVLDCPLLRLQCFVRDEQGHLVTEREVIVEPSFEIRHRPVMRIVEVALRTPLPAWWQPREVPA